MHEHPILLQPEITLAFGILFFLLVRFPFNQSEVELSTQPKEVHLSFMLSLSSRFLCGLNLLLTLNLIGLTLNFFGLLLGFGLSSLGFNPLCVVVTLQGLRQLGSFEFLSGSFGFNTGTGYG